MPYKFLPHTADVKILASGNSLEKSFKSSAEALTQTIAENIKVKPKIKKQISIKGNDLESMLYNFLEEFLYLLDAEDFLLSKVENLTIKKTPNKLGKRWGGDLINKKTNNKTSKASPIFQLNASLTGDKASNYKFTNSVKAITYNDMFVKRQKNKFICQVVLDV